MRSSELSRRFLLVNAFEFFPQLSHPLSIDKRCKRDNVLPILQEIPFGSTLSKRAIHPAALQPAWMQLSTLIRKCMLLLHRYVTEAVRSIVQTWL